MTKQKHQGYITAYLPNRGFGFLASSDPDNTTRFFFHISRITSGIPKIGAEASFAILPVREGNCPSAIDVEIVDENLDAESETEPAEASSGVKS